MGKPCIQAEESGGALVERHVDVGATIDAGPLSRLQLCVFAFCSAAAAVDGFDTQSIGVTARSISHDLGIPQPDLGIVFSSMLLGATLGAALFGVLGDAWGRRPAIIGAMLLFALFTLATPLANSFDSLVVIRLLAGIGLGGLAPGILALGADYAPERLDRTIASLLWIGFPCGAMIGGFLNAMLLEHSSWRIVFVVGGVAPLCLAIASMVFLPESIRFLVLRNQQPLRVISLMRRLAPDLPVDANTRFQLQQRLPRVLGWRASVSLLRTRTTMLLWVAFVTVLPTLTILTLWTPVLLAQHNFSPAATAVLVGFNNVGALVGTACAGRILEALGPRALCAALLPGAAAVAGLGFSGGDLRSAAALMALAGLCIGGAGTGCIALAAHEYPAAARATGLGWAIGVGRFGQFAAPLIVGFLNANQLPVSAILCLTAGAPAIGALAVFALPRNRARAAAAP